MVRLLAITFASVTFAVASTTLAAIQDPVRAKLDKASEAYATEAEKVKSAVLDWLERSERTARDRGDKKAVDQLLAERKTVTNKGLLPAEVPVAIARQSASARTKMETAYRTAVKDYTKAKQDADAETIERQLDTFRRTASGLTLAEWVRVRAVGRWLRRHDGQVFVLDADGKVSEFNVDNKPVTTGKWTIEKDGTGTVPLANGWKFTFTLSDDNVMTAPARNPSGRPEGRWELKKSAK